MTVYDVSVTQSVAMQQQGGRNHPVAAANSLSFAQEMARSFEKTISHSLVVSGLVTESLAGQPVIQNIVLGDIVAVNLKVTRQLISEITLVSEAAAYNTNWREVDITNPSTNFILGATAAGDGTVISGNGDLAAISPSQLASETEDLLQRLEP